MSRNHTIDYVRLISAFGVILIHLAPSSLNAEIITRYFEIGAVPFFLVTSLYLFQSKAARFDEINFSRILIPYASWSAIYLISRAIKNLLTHTKLDCDWFAIVFLGGSAVQLYFLPLLLCFLIIASAIDTLFADRECKTSVKFLAILSIILLFAASSFLEGSSYLGFGNNFFPMALQYIVFSKAILTLTPCLIKMRNQVFFCGVASAPALLFLGVESKIFSNGLVSLLLVSIILIACLMCPVYTVSKVKKSVLSATYGIYLCHHLFVEIIEFALDKSSLTYSPYSISSKLIVAFIVIILSTLFVLLIRRWEILAFLLLGEARSNKTLESA